MTLGSVRVMGAGMVLIMGRHGDVKEVCRYIYMTIKYSL